MYNNNYINYATKKRSVEVKGDRQNNLLSNGVVWGHPYDIINFLVEPFFLSYHSLLQWNTLYSSLMWCLKCGFTYVMWNHTLFRVQYIYVETIYYILSKKKLVIKWKQFIEMQWNFHRLLNRRRATPTQNNRRLHQLFLKYTV